MIWGTLALVFVGLTWSVTGIVMGQAPKRGVDTSAVQFASALFGIVVSIAVLFFLPCKSCSAKVFLLTCGAFFLYGFLNFMMLQIMAMAMQRGPNGIIWGIIQSAVVFPFLTGIVFFGVALTPVRAAGMALLLTSLAVFGLCRSNSNGPSGKTWKLVTFLDFLLCGIVMMVSNLPSYNPEAEAVSSVTRTMFTCIGTLCGALVYNIFRVGSEKSKTFLLNLRKQKLWEYVGALQGFSLVCGYFFFYNGLNALAKAGAGSIAYPLLIGSCIIGFSLYSMVFLEERPTLPQYLALATCMAGVVCVSL